tara:strand:+ start:298 stop:645 length:348 start_codon:yes stop_codon:yes gene_type:complete
MKILVCGSREWTDKNKIKKELSKYSKEDVLIHGGCRGADKLAGEVGKELGMKIEVYYADWKTHGKKAGPLRNQQMLDEGKPDKVYAFHEDIDSSKGTKDMVNRAKKEKLEIKIVS